MYVLKLKKLLTDPILIFFLLGSFLFGLDQFFNGQRREIIVVDAAKISQLSEEQSEALGQSLNEEQLNEAIANYIDDEILVREARKRGFSDTSRIRSMLSQNMRFFIQGEIPNPSEEELRAYFEANTDYFALSESVLFQEIMFDFATEIPKGTLESLNNGSIPQDPPQRIRKSRITAVFGAQFAKAVFSQNVEG